ncbi:transthyretin isoform X2 [Xiphias gladius]|uniref:transthyretin isoform X2 n=1 Tax=Xiphias gladius TaxID=8245 RepID=UPI001A99D86A|nr:transthyretin isoform X2 [Xiphias gladius]
MPAKSTKEKHGGSDTKCPLMVKILDAVKGTPAGSVPLKVSQKSADGGWMQIANGVTDATGEIHNLITEEQFPAGVYRVEFDTKAYWKNEGSVPFHEVADQGGHSTTAPRPSPQLDFPVPPGEPQGIPRPDVIYKLSSMFWVYSRASHQLDMPRNL